jgi:hypothetical protein
MAVVYELSTGYQQPHGGHTMKYNNRLRTTFDSAVGLAVVVAVVMAVIVSVVTFCTAAIVVGFSLLR